MKRLLSLVLSLHVLTISAQHITWEAFLEQLTEEQAMRGEDIMETLGDDAQWADFIEELNELHEHPIDLNSATEEDFARMFFLSDEAVEGILRHRDYYGHIRSVSELAVVESVSWRERQLLHLFTYVNPQEEEYSDRWDFSLARSEVTADVSVPLYKRDGWPWARGMANRIRWDYKLSHHLQVGVRGESDAGERMFCRKTPLWDALGVYASLTTKGWMQNLLVGDYKASFAEGVVVGHSFRFGKMMGSQWRNPSGLKVHRSADEVNFFRGAAADFRLASHWTLSPFFSYRRLDAVIQPDNSINNLISSGLHRTDNELSHRRTVGSMVAGGHIEWSSNGWSAGMTGLFQRYDHQFLPGSSLYQQIAPQGHQFGAVSLNYAYRRRPWLFSGETARSFTAGKDGWALLHRVAWKASSAIQLAAIHRFYSQYYFSPYGNSFGENSKNQNESGLCLMADVNWDNSFALSACADVFYSPFPRYSMTRSSRGGEGMLQASWQGRRHGICVTYRIKSKERSDARYWSHRIRGAWSYQPSEIWGFQASAQTHLYRTSGSTSLGYALMGTSRLTAKRWQWRAMLSFFHTDDFYSRIYFYEPNLIQTFSFPALFYHGARLASTLRWQSASDIWMVETKFGTTRYFNRDEISSGPTRIASPWKSDLQILVRVRF
ncbi:MAG: helix-hairpin-helix domain-containing protein [Bacteroidaceae bacterium]|nr:helix-hairpin-helix domain-containing protein [Bacteroidaceae bacterium]